MDEISMGLAPIIVDELFESVGRLKAAGVAMLLVEQFLTYALRLADVCYVVGKGRVQFKGGANLARRGDWRLDGFGSHGAGGFHRHRRRGGRGHAGAGALHAGRA
jgi:energy-coupling factor transporter ATP-binding protein EcfA2